MIWHHRSDAWMSGFLDGFLEDYSTLVENYNNVYEVGFICGAFERRELEREGTDYATRVEV